MCLCFLSEIHIQLSTEAGWRPGIGSMKGRKCQHKPWQPALWPPQGCVTWKAPEHCDQGGREGGWWKLSDRKWYLLDDCAVRNVTIARYFQVHSMVVLSCLIKKDWKSTAFNYYIKLENFLNYTNINFQPSWHAMDIARIKPCKNLLITLISSDCICSLVTTRTGPPQVSTTVIHQSLTARTQDRH